MIASNQMAPPSTVNPCQLPQTLAPLELRITHRTAESNIWSKWASSCAGVRMCVGLPCKRTKTGYDTSEAMATRSSFFIAFCSSRKKPIAMGQSGRVELSLCVQFPAWPCAPVTRRAAMRAKAKIVGRAICYYNPAGTSGVCAHSLIGCTLPQSRHRVTG